MAQIIKHRRGSLEAVSSATKRAGELLVVTGSAGITATNGNSILFVGIDGSTVTPANKILQGTTTPDLTGATYDTSIDGIPFYNTSQEKLFIVNKAGNVEVKATANTGGTGIVSGSSQVTALLPTGTISSSAQVDADSITNFDSNVKSKLDAETVVSGSSQITYANISSIPAGIVSGSSQVTPLLPTGTISSSAQVDADSITNFDSNVKSKLDADGVISGSSQVQIDSVTGFSAFSSSVATNFSSSDASITSLSASVASVTGNFSSSVATTFINVEASQSIQNGRLDQLETDSGSQAGRLNNLESFSSSIETAITVNGSDVTVNGNFTVSGTTTTVNSTTVDIGDNIVQLNGSAAAFGGLIIVDATAPNQVSGSLLWDATNDYWIAGASGSESKLLRANGDSVISGSSQVNADSITNFDENVKDKLNADAVVSGSLLGLLPTGVVSGSSQVIGHLVGNDISTNGISGSSLNITGNAKIDGNLVLGGNITIGDAAGDTISFSGEVSSDIIPSADNTHDLGSASDRFAEVHATTIFGSISATNGIVSGSSQVNADSITNFDENVKAKLDADTVISGSSQVNADSITNFDTNVKDKLNADTVISGSSQLDSTTINLATLTNVSASGSFSGSFTGDGSNLTGLVTDLRISGSTGNDVISLLTDSLLVTGSNSISAAVSDNTITITAANASTSVKGVASFSATNFDVSSGNVAIKANGVTAATLNADVAGTGLSLNGGDNSLQVDYGSSSGTAVEGNTSLTVQGTANEIEITGGSITLGSGGTVTIGLPDDVTISGSLTANGNVYLGNSSADSVTIAGNLYVQGTTTTVDSTTVQIGDNIIELNGSGAANGGLLVKDVTNPNTASGSLLWDSTNDYWKAGALGSEKEVARFSSSPTTSGSVQVIGASGLFVNSQISDDAVKVTIGTDLVINGLTANSFVVSNGSKKLISVTPSNAGDLIQWNGSSFIASNELDGGTF